MSTIAAALWVAIAGFVYGTEAQASDGATHGISMHGAPQLSPGDRLPYADPNAPQGGRITFGALGSFDNLNPLIPRGSLGPGTRDLLYGNLVYESLLDRNRAEPFALYGLLASEVIVPPERDFVTFKLAESARFSDGTPVTADDVAFTWALLKEKGWPYARNYYAKVEDVDVADARTITFRFPNANDRELPLILGLMPILPEHDTNPDEFSRTTLDPPVGTGPYRIADVVPGRSITYAKNPDYWAQDLPINSGRYNADEIRFLFFRDENAMFEAFKTGEIDAFMEADTGRWAQSYDFPALSEGNVARLEIPTRTPRGMWAFVMNTRRPPFDDKRVREALGYLFDFEWINKQLFFDLRSRTDSFFSNSALSSPGRPASDGERQLLSPFPDAVEPRMLEGEWRPPVSDGSGRDRTNIRAALKLLGEAGWRIDNGRLVNGEGEQLSFEILVATRDDERLALAFQRMLRPAGIDARVRYVDSSQYNQRMLGFDFDMARVYWPASLSPGNEQTHRWSTNAATTEGTFNYAGAQEPAVDAMIASMLAAKDREAFEDAVRALDRVLLSGHYVIPLFHTPVQYVAHWNRLGRPEQHSLSGIEWETWWVK
ncbi:MAG: extracellular solute-binding protein [Pseudomonadota bacterium]